MVLRWLTCCSLLVRNLAQNEMSKEIHVLIRGLGQSVNIMPKTFVFLLFPSFLTTSKPTIPENYESADFLAGG